MSLLTKREQLQAQLEKVEGQLAALLGEEAPAAPRGRGRAARGGGAKGRASARAAAPRGGGKKKGRGALKSGILAALKAAGAEGVSIKDLVSKLGSKSSNLHAWFNVTGKKMGNIKKIGRGIYRLEE